MLDNYHDVNDDLALMNKGSGNNHQHIKIIIRGLHNYKIKWDEQSNEIRVDIKTIYNYATSSLFRLS